MDIKIDVNMHEIIDMTTEDQLYRMITVQISTRQKQLCNSSCNPAALHWLTAYSFNLCACDRRYFLSSLRGNGIFIMWRERTACGVLTLSSLSFRPAISCPSSYPFPTSKTISADNTSYCRQHSTMPSSVGPHVKSRCPQYPGSNIKRLSVPDDKVDWTQKWPEYNPVSYTAPSVLNNPAWADPDIGWATNSTFNAYQVHSGSAMRVM